MRYILVLQWPASTDCDFESMVEMEDALESSMGDVGTVDGHDFGAGEMSIFIHTNHPTCAFARAKAILGDRPAWSAVRAAFRQADGDIYDVLWPPGLTSFNVQ